MTDSRWNHFKTVRKPQIEAEKAACVVSRDDMRDCIAAALFHAKPSFRVEKRLEKAFEYFAATNAGNQVYSREYADDLLIALDHLGLEIRRHEE